VPGTTIGGFPIPTGPNANPPAIGAATPASFTQNSTTFYWVESANPRPLEYQIALNNGSSLYLYAWFNVVGPTSPNAVAVTGTVDVAQNIVVNNGVPSLDPSGLQVLIADGIPATPTGVNFQLPFSAGITISASATLPPATPGQFLFVQLLNPFNVLYTADGFLNGGCNLVGIDAHYGYAAAGPAGNVTYMYDAPAIPLVAPATYAAVVFDATTYVMWQSSLNSSIPVPLGYIDWSWTGTAFYLPVALWGFGPLVANTLQAGPFTASAVYPT